jgi:hypothetical protein
MRHALDNYKLAVQSIRMKTQRPRLIARRFGSVRRRGEHERPSRGRHLDIPAWLNAAFTLALAIFAYEAWDESQRARIVFQDQLTAAQGQLTAARESQRAWLTLELDLASNFEKLTGGDYVMVGFTGVTYQITFNYKIKNVGHLPAQAVLVKFTHVIPQFQPPKDSPKEEQELLAQERKICTGPRNPSDGMTIFPEEPPLESKYSIRVHKNDWPKGPFPSKSYLYLAGCVIYRIGDDKKDHHTAFAYDVEAKDGHIFAFPDNPTTIEAGKLRLTSLPFADLLTAD